MQGAVAHFGRLCYSCTFHPKVVSSFFSPTKCWNRTKLWCAWESPAGCVGLEVEQISVLTGEERKVFGFCFSSEVILMN